jgi:uncharacterized protein
VKQADVLVQAVRDVDKAVHQLRNRHRLAEMAPQLVEIHRLENVGDENHYSALSALFDGTHETIEVIRWKALYDLLESAIDGCEDVANTLQRIALRNQ